ncbi:hypothetical protein BFU36_03440 [Sulfolobus sp. A20]|uniref:DUF790 family protein n=1 Tax=Sulfolobaceae TaxID=118883 RepID=UPI000846199D|nr:MULTISPECIES: DUF790 family protein [unclassified Sulfolobus]TRM75609.1 DUF790 domain-containing protein [Sulfolobus sp. E5]TRM78541.1 DUF790 domain-containing protein [Sulfolobus sp. A20-N-F8]TRM79269.1 DUF790 domain-containing protein [Sulfolobus sp. B5]TRM82078.1 DUF790 domain-containing protein [Sulfolobus sp. D5]TRM82675.1 DUF790 domain-containing protein [Sulfolobus sp. A20-N-F6]TRM95345.1 DUF790 domain-containing protein [Sulfolobus sp. A20-N-G8]TRN02058.1 DUF790 domain-containing 
MLPSELARYKIMGNKIYPLFAQSDDIEIADDVMRIFEIGRKVGEILDDVKYLSKIYDYKLVKGLARTFLKYCEIESESKIDYRELRREIFKRGPVYTEEEREKVIGEVKEIFRVDPIKVMYEDLDEERKIVKLPDNITAEDLIKIYNLSLLQTIVFNAYRITIFMSEGWKEIARKIKMLGLMYLAYDKPIHIDIFGPLSLLRMTEKYGKNLASLIPFVVSRKDWKIIASVVLGKRKRTYKLELSNTHELFKYVRDEEIEKRFDSSIEEKFYNDFRKVIKDWLIIREPEPFVIDNRLYFPDFLLQKNNVKVYVEIMGFWTKEYINNKLEKLKHFPNPILIILNEELSYENYIPSSLNIIKFKRKIDIGKIYNYLRTLLPAVEVKEINLGDINDHVISIKELANKYNVDEKVIREKLTSYKDYIVLKNYAIKRTYLEEISKNNFTDKSLSELINAYGNYIVDVIEYLGYIILWKNISDAIVKKIKEA